MQRDSDMPDVVKRVSILLQSFGIWHQITRNPRVTSCKDAADKRTRLGKKGIPLSDELKSFLGQYNDGSGKRYVLAHCNADVNLDFDLLAKALNSKGPIERIDSTEAEQLGFGYGIVHPFLKSSWQINNSLIQIFDVQVVGPRPAPCTMMTNVGHHEWGVEFYPLELLKSLGEKSARVENICSEKSVDYKPKSVGIITGNSPESGMVLWRYFNTHFRSKLGGDFLGDISYPRVIVHSNPEMGLSMELETRDQSVWPCIRESLEEMLADGVRVFGIACHTTQYYRYQIRDVVSKHNGVFVDASNALGEFCQERNLHKFSFIGGRQSASFGKWSAFTKLKNNFDIELLSDRGKSYVHDLGYDIKREGPTQKSMQKLQQIIRREFTSSLCIIGLTELSTLLQDFGKPKLANTETQDLLDIVALRMVDLCLEQ